MDPEENSGQLLQEDIATIYGLNDAEEAEDEKATPECSGSDS